MARDASELNYKMKTEQELEKTKYELKEKQKELQLLLGLEPGTVVEDMSKLDSIPLGQLNAKDVYAIRVINSKKEKELLIIRQEELQRALKEKEQQRKAPRRLAMIREDGKIELDPKEKEEILEKNPQIKDETVYLQERSGKLETITEKEYEMQQKEREKEEVSFIDQIATDAKIPSNHIIQVVKVQSRAATAMANKNLRDEEVVAVRTTHIREGKPAWVLLRKDQNGKYVMESDQSQISDVMGEITKELGIKKNMQNFEIKNEEVQDAGSQKGAIVRRRVLTVRKYPIDDDGRTALLIEGSINDVENFTLPNSTEDMDVKKARDLYEKGDTNAFILALDIKLRELLEQKEKLLSQIEKLEKFNKKGQDTKTKELYADLKDVQKEIDAVEVEKQRVGQLGEKQRPEGGRVRGEIPSPFPTED